MSSLCSKNKRTGLTSPIPSEGIVFHNVANLSMQMFKSSQRNVLDLSLKYHSNSIPLFVSGVWGIHSLLNPPQGRMFHTRALFLVRNPKPLRTCEKGAQTQAAARITLGSRVTDFGFVFFLSFFLIHFSKGFSEKERPVFSWDFSLNRLKKKKNPMNWDNFITCPLHPVSIDVPESCLWNVC